MKTTKVTVLLVSLLCAAGTSSVPSATAMPATASQDIRCHVGGGAYFPLTMTVSKTASGSQWKYVLSATKSYVASDGFRYVFYYFDHGTGGSRTTANPKTVYMNKGGLFYAKAWWGRDLIFNPNRSCYLRIENHAPLDAGEDQ